LLKLLTIQGVFHICEMGQADLGVPKPFERGFEALRDFLGILMVYAARINPQVVDARQIVLDVLSKGLELAEPEPF
jgi:hypothetical protein